MKNNTKICRGTGKAIGYGCKNQVPIARFNQPNRVYGLGKSCGCYANWLLNTPEGIIKLSNATLTATKPRTELERAIKEKKERNGLTTLVNSTVKVCHEFIRLRDRHKPCISCGTSWHKGFHAGHFKKAELFTTIKLDEFNINGQCPQCNLRKDGNEAEYALRLPLRIGQDNYDELIRLSELDHSINFKWDREVLKNIRSYYRKELKILQAGEL